MATTDNRLQLRLGGNLRSDLVPANGRRESRTAWATGEGAVDGDKCCNCQASVRAAGRSMVRQTTLHLPGSRRWASGQGTNMGRPHGRMDEFYHYSVGTPTVRLVKQ